MRSTACTREPSTIFSLRKPTLSPRKKTSRTIFPIHQRQGKARSLPPAHQKKKTVPVPAAASAKKILPSFFFAISSCTPQQSVTLLPRLFSRFVVHGVYSSFSALSFSGAGGLVPLLPALGIPPSFPAAFPAETLLFLLFSCTAEVNDCSAPNCRAPACPRLFRSVAPVIAEAGIRSNAFLFFFRIPDEPRLPVRNR